MRRLAYLALLLPLACATEPDPLDYDATCDADSDCVAVVDEGFCGRCDSWTALEAQAAQDFSDDQADYAETVECQRTILPYCGGLAEPPSVRCNQGRCDVGESDQRATR